MPALECLSPVDSMSSANRLSGSRAAPPGSAQVLQFDANAFRDSGSNDFPEIERIRSAHIGFLS